MLRVSPPAPSLPTAAARWTDSRMWGVVPTLRPMPRVRVAGPFDHPDWIFELDGFRALAHVEGSRCTLVSRRRHVYRQSPC